MMLIVTNGKTLIADIMCPIQKPEKPLVALMAFALQRDMFDMSFSEVNEAFEAEISVCTKLGYSRNMCYDTVLYNVVTDSKDNWGEFYDLADAVYCK